MLHELHSDPNAINLREIWQKAKFKSQAGQGLLFSFLVNFALS